VPLFKEVISLRQEKAILVGQPDFMTYKMRGDSILGSPDAVRKLLPRFRERVANIGVLESLKETKRLDSNAKDKTLYLWDEPYYKRMWLEKDYSVDHQETAEYFPVWPVVEGMLQIYGEMFGLDFQPVVNADVWHEDVKLFAVWDTAEPGVKFSGYLYVDPFPRSGKFRGGKCCSLKIRCLFPTIFQDSHVLTSLQQRAALRCSLAS
jgi:metallopeptidase MepB